MNSKSKINYIQDNPIINNINDVEGMSKQTEPDFYDDNLDQLKGRSYGYRGSTLNNNFNNPYNQTEIKEITTDKEKEELSNDPEKLLQYSIANFKRRVNKYNSKF